MWLACLRFRPRRRTGRAGLRPPEVEGATPLFGPLVRHRGESLVRPYVRTSPPPLWGGRSLHSDPCGKAIEPMMKSTFMILMAAAATTGIARTIWTPHERRLPLDQKKGRAT